MKWYCSQVEKSLFIDLFVPVQTPSTKGNIPLNLLVNLGTCRKVRIDGFAPVQHSVLSSIFSFYFSAGFTKQKTML